jgi:hypothetical protein
MLRRLTSAESRRRGRWPALLATCVSAGIAVGEDRRPIDPALQRQFVAEYTARDAKRRDVLAEYIRRVGPETTLQLVEARYPFCHDEGHELGAAIYSETRNLAEALHVCAHRCTGGCMHGVIRAAFGDKTLDDVERSLEEFCDDPAMSMHRPGNCAHALGHALMVVSKRDLGRSLAACSSHSSAAMGYYCATGVYMEYFIDPPTIARDASLHYPCDTQELYPAACYRYLGATMLVAFRGDGRELARECERLSGRRRLGCFHGLGAAQAVAVSSRPQSLAEVCGYGTGDDQAACIEGAIERNSNEQVALAACAGLSPQNATVCEAAARGKMYRLDKPTLRLYTRDGGASQQTTGAR